MVVRAYTTLGVGDALEGRARAILATLDALADEGEPILSVFRAADDQPWIVDILFAHTPVEAQAAWLSEARALLPDLADFSVDPLAERDWVAESQKALRPVRAGRFVVHGSHDSATLPPSRWRLCIDAGRAFGTAHHASTQGCLVALERRAKWGPLGTVADVGTGSGVLALAAERLGARAIVAGDIDPDAVEVAQANIRANRVSRLIRCRVAAGPVGTADVVIANILARPLIAMAAQLGPSARDTLILSGLRLRDARPVFGAYRARGFFKRDAVVIENWITLTLQRQGPTPTAPVAQPRWAHASSPGW